MITFHHVKWKNFLSTGNVWTEIQLDRSKSTLIIGNNGAGKSTILDAISYALYGKPFRKVSKNQLLNAINMKKAELEVEFTSGPHRYRIEREIKKSGSAKFEIYKDNELVPQNASVRDYQEYLERHVLKLNQKSFSQIVILGSATFMPFMQLSTQHRREVIEDILDIQIFSTMNALLKAKVSENRSSLQELNYRLDLTKEKIEMQKRHIESLRKNNDDRIDTLQESLKTYQSEIDEHYKVIEQTNAEIDALYAQIDDRDALNKKKSKLNQFEYKLKDKIANLKTDISFYEKNDDCPTCKQSIEQEFKQEIVGNKNKSLTETQQGLETLHDEYTKLDERLREIETILLQIRNLENTAREHNTNVATNTRMQASIREEISKLQEGNQSDEKELEALNTLNLQLKTGEKAKEKLTEEKSVLDVSQLILRDNGIKTKIIKQYIPVMNKLINKYLRAMDFFVHFELDENFNETIKSRYRDEFTYSSFSEGEKMRIDLALLFTWRAVAKLRNSVSTNLLIMDEVFDSSLDTNGTEEFIKILNDLTSDANVFIISHKGDQLYDKFHSVIKFEKHKNFSRIAQ